jgi:hypothetical protein
LIFKGFFVLRNFGRCGGEGRIKGSKGGSNPKPDQIQNLGARQIDE